MGALSYVVWALPILFALVWMSGRFYAYFLWTAEQGLQDFIATVLPDNYHPSVAEGFWLHGVKVLYEERLTSTRVHVGFGVVWGLAAILQLLPFVRNYAGFAVHRALGWVFLACTAVFVVQMTYILFVIGMVEVGQGMFVADVISLVLIAIAVPLGYYYIRTGQVNKHRSMMILATAGVFSNATQRFVWVLVSKSEVYWGHMESWEAWKNGPSTASAYLGMVIVLIVGLYYALSTKADNEAIKRGLKKKKAKRTGQKGSGAVGKTAATKAKAKGVSASPTMGFRSTKKAN